MKVFSERIRSERQRLGKKQAEVADFLGIPVQNYSTYENNREPSYDTLCRIADCFDVSVDYLLGRIDEKSDADLKSSIAATGLNELITEQENKHNDPLVGERTQKILNAQLMLLVKILVAEDISNASCTDDNLTGDDICTLFVDIMLRLFLIVDNKDIAYKYYEGFEGNIPNPNKEAIALKNYNENYRFALKEIIDLLSRYYEHKFFLLKDTLSQK